MHKTYCTTKSVADADCSNFIVIIQYAVITLKCGHSKPTLLSNAGAFMQLRRVASALPHYQLGFGGIGVATIKMMRS